MNSKILKCNISKKCGSCQLIDKTYDETLKTKLNNVNNLLKQNKINYTIKEINQDISNDPSLGEEFEIGHSYFCNLNDVTDDLLYRIVSFEILPL